MKARRGDRIVIEGRTVGQPRREGTVVEVVTGHSYRVRWSSGDETIFFPQNNCIVIGSGVAEKSRARAMTDTADIDLQGVSSRHPNADLSIWFDEDEDHTEARVTIRLRGFEVTGFGRAKRNPHDPNMPAVGEELSAARAMSDLAHQLLDLATYQIEKTEGHPVAVDL